MYTSLNECIIRSCTCIVHVYMYSTCIHVHYIQHTLCDNRAGVTVEMLLVSNTSFMVSVFIGNSSPLDKLRV